MYWTVTLQLSRRLRVRRTAADHRWSKQELFAGSASYARWIQLYDSFEENDLARMHEFAHAMPDKPLVSLVMPVFDTPERYLREAIESVRAQAYENWELCIADDGSTAPHIRTVLQEYERREPRIRVVHSAWTGGISAASNAALELASGELVGFMDHDDLLRPHALLLAVAQFAENPDVAYVYSDEDKVDLNGERFGHYFKPDWNPTLLLSQNYLCHFSVVRAELIRAVGGFRSEYDGSQDWDLALRITETLPLDAVAHVPHVLYHWRATPSSAASGIDAKPYALVAARRAAEDHLRRTGHAGYVVPVNGHQSVRYLVPTPRPRVTAIVPSTGRADLLEPCLEGLLHRTDYAELDILIAVDERAFENASTDRLLRRLSRHPRVTVDAFPARSFNYAWTINQAVDRAGGELLLFLNDDTTATRDDWLGAMVGHVVQDHVGAVGAKLLYPDETIQHAGVLLGGGDAAHLYRGRRADVAGYVNRARLPQELSAVTGACMLVRREAFDEVDGFDERFEVAYNDIDFCLRLRRVGWRVVFVPDAALIHRETESFGSLVDGREGGYERERQLMRERWPLELRQDPAHNPNLDLDASHPSRLAFPPRVSYPWRKTGLAVSGEP